MQQLKRICGLSVERVELPRDKSHGVYVDERAKNTVFIAEHGSKSYAFSIDGTDEKTRIAAALAREVVVGIMNKTAVADEPLRAFLDGTGDVPHGVRVGKSDYYVFAVYSDTPKKNVRDYLKTMATANDFVAEMTEYITAFCKKIDNDNDYQSAGEFALVLKENLAEEMKERIKIGVGGVAHGVSELPQYYAYAKSALVGGAEFDPQSDIYSYKEYALIKALSDMSATAMERYVKTVLDKRYREVLADTELMQAADAFFKHSLNISEASRNMYVHRNTLIYRLDKIEKLTGLNIRNFNDAMTFRMACLVSKML